MGAQLSLKAALPLAERLAAVSYHCSNIGPSELLLIGAVAEFHEAVLACDTRSSAN